MSANETGQVASSAAEIYEAFFLPALFQQWVEPLLKTARVRPGQQVLDVACGTGVLARAAARWVGPGGSVVGIDINDGMLAVARRQAPTIEWHQGQAEALPFVDDRFDAVVSQFGLMFFTDRLTAIREMVRVVRPGGRLVVAVWDSLERTPGYAAMTALLNRLFGHEIAQALSIPFVLGDRNTLRTLFAESGLPGARITTREGTARFPSLRSWVHTDIRGWTLAHVIDEPQLQLLEQEAARELKRFVNADGTVTFSAPAHIVTVVKP